MIYENKTPIRILRLLELLLGVVIAIGISYRLSNELFTGALDIFACLLGLALISGGLSGKKVKSIGWDGKSETLIIEEVSLFSRVEKACAGNLLTSRLLVAEKRKPLEFGKSFRWRIYTNESDFVELSPTIFWGRKKIRNGHEELKGLLKAGGDIQTP